VTGQEEGFGVPSIAAVPSLLAVAPVFLLRQGYGGQVAGAGLQRRRTVRGEVAAPPPANWRETGAKTGDFRLQTAIIGSLELRADTKKSIIYLLRRPLPRLGSGMGSCFRFLPRRLQHLRQYIFNRLRRNLQSLKTESVWLWDVVFHHQFDLISGDRRSRQSF